MDELMESASEQFIATAEVGDKTVNAVIDYWESVPGNPKRSLVTVRISDKIFAGVAHGAWPALKIVQEQLEACGITLACNGTSLNVHPSGMSLDMGGGYKAYRLTGGKR